MHGASIPEIDKLILYLLPERWLQIRYRIERYI